MFITLPHHITSYPSPLSSIANYLDFPPGQENHTLPQAKGNTLFLLHCTQKGNIKSFTSLKNEFDKKNSNFLIISTTT